VKNKIALIISVIALFSLCSCNSIAPTEPQENPYILVNGLTPTQFEGRLKDFIYDIYEPKNQDSIDRGIREFKEIATETEALEIENTVGEFREDKKATISNLSIDLCMPDNSSSYNYKLLATFSISLNESYQNILIEFGCDSNGKINNHSIWVNNDRI